MRVTSVFIYISHFQSHLRKWRHLWLALKWDPEFGVLIGKLIAEPIVLILLFISGLLYPSKFHFRDLRVTITLLPGALQLVQFHVSCG